MAKVVYRFTCDLRLDDHAGIASAAADGEIVPVLVIDKVVEANLAQSPRRAAFFCAAVRALDASLRERGARLIVRRGAPATTLRNIARAAGAHGVSWSASYDGRGSGRDAALQSELEEAGLRATPVHDAPAIPPEETTAARSDGGDGYRAFVPYFETWRELTTHVYEAPLLVQFAAGELQSEAFPEPQEFGGADAMQASAALAQERLRAFLNAPGLQFTVGANAPAEDGTSRLSADLAFGTISARTIVRATLERAQDPFLLVEERASLRLYLRSLAMRDFFLQLAWYHPRSDDESLQERMRAFAFSKSHGGLDAWRAGRTGYPFVDAGIRQLHATGWMHPRVRAVAASFLCFDLGVDWRVGHEEWQRHAIDDEPAISTGNWQWIAGVGADMAQHPRIYNPEKQRRRFDPTGSYVRRWIGELSNAPTFAAPSRTRNQIELPLFAADPYPLPVVDHEREARAFLDRYRLFTAKN